MNNLEPSTSPTPARITRHDDGRLVIRAHAKLNLGLRVFPARPDGFHDLETWMLPISWHDTLTLLPGGPLQLQITGRSVGVPTDLQKNLVGRAALKLAEAANIPPTGTIQLHKVLPPGGGIGGGSADAGNVLVALNELWQLHFSHPQLQAIAAHIGSDVPFFVPAQPSLCTGRGEIMTPLLPAHPLFAVLILPDRGLPTKDVYQAFDAGHQHKNLPPTPWPALAASTADQLNTLLLNDLEPPAFAIASWLAELRQHAASIIAQPVHLTGSGSTLFTLASSSLAAAELQNRLTSQLPSTAICIPVRIHRASLIPLISSAIHSKA